MCVGQQTAAFPHNTWRWQRWMAKRTFLGQDFTFTPTPSQGTSGKFSLFSLYTDMEKQFLEGKHFHKKHLFNTGKKQPFGCNTGSSAKLKPISRSLLLSPPPISWSPSHSHVAIRNVSIFYSLFPLFSSKEIGFHSIHDHSALSLAQLEPTLSFFVTRSYKDIRLTRLFRLYPKNSASWSKNRSGENKGWERVVMKMSLR